MVALGVVMVVYEVPAHMSHSQSSNLLGALPVEQWRPAPGLDGYEVSSLGRARSWVNRRGIRQLSPHFVGFTRGGYRMLRPHHIGPSVRIHRLICEAFHGPAPFEGAEVRHLDDDGKNNRPENLAWGTTAENAADRTRNGNSRSPRNSRFTDDQVRAIRRLSAAGWSGTDIAALSHVTPGAIYKILQGRSYRWVS